MAVNSTPTELSPQTVPLGTGLPTREEMLVYYPAKFTWTQLKTFVNSGDLGLLKRDRTLQKRYEGWSQGIKEKYGSIVNYLLNYRLQWGQPDTLSVLRSSLDERPAQKATNGTTPSLDPKAPGKLPPLPANAPRYFRADIPPELLSIAMNDWPYSVPPDVEHSLIWSRVPILPPDLPAPSASPISARLHQDGLWGFTGTDSPPPSPSTLPACLPALADWGVTMDKLVRSPRGTEEEERAVKRYGEEIETFVKRRWNEREWETAWFVNPPRLQSVPDLTHIHVFARRKSPEQIAKADIDAQHE
ncbi:uncharacterized protein TRAVEDRAFT_46663 [Trametes versicolor FP-101664 SS1]|uniref:uncharacterized protein n=1 Tax=Trametes versicolor (strain FP-101664) TaxID=717944 RepID=UPI0004621562|nr:uncharacterized protein TRAVEDRAFT_46663 [Trametes versicolor FP-101664 SS1]EIW59356.1 hypothetical protein TRAVEDRAFT_46663 [Trametes versicolor FP-101664 SS1]